jgi:hypothetical protein
MEYVCTLLICSSTIHIWGKKKLFFFSNCIYSEKFITSEKFNQKNTKKKSFPTIAIVYWYVYGAVLLVTTPKIATNFSHKLWFENGSSFLHSLAKIVSQRYLRIRQLLVLSPFLTNSPSIAYCCERALLF